MGIPLAGGALLLVLMVAAVAIRLRTARGSLAATTGQQPRRVSLQRLLGAGQSTGPVGEGIVIESQAQLDSSTRLHAIRWAGGRLLLATHTQFAPTLLDRAEGQPPQREEAP